MAPKKKKNKLVIKLVSGAGTGFFYIFKKTPQIAQKKLALRKFDPIVNQYVIFNEAKLKYSTTINRPSFPTFVPQFQQVMKQPTLALQQQQQALRTMPTFAKIGAFGALTALAAYAYKPTPFQPKI